MLVEFAVEVPLEPVMGSDMVSPFKSRCKSIEELDELAAVCMTDSRVSILPSRWAIRASDSFSFRAFRLRAESDGWQSFLRRRHLQKLLVLS